MSVLSFTASARRRSFLALGRFRLAPLGQRSEPVELLRPSAAFRARTDFKSQLRAGGSEFFGLSERSEPSGKLTVPQRRTRRARTSKLRARNEN